MKKIISTIAAAAMAATSISAFSALAVDESVNNAITVSTSVVNEATIVDGTVIPAGSTAVTVSIDNNTGFDAFSTKFELDNVVDIIKTFGNEIVINEGIALGDSAIVGSENNGVIAFSSASADVNREDGALFTFYTSSLSSTDEIDIVNSSFHDYSESSINTSASTDMIIHIHFIHGDANNDDDIDLQDAVAYEQARAQFTGGIVPFSYVKNHLSEVFPGVTYYQAIQIYEDERSITYQDYTYVILLYDAAMTSGQGFDPSSISDDCILGHIVNRDVEI